jgi:hypothetical protein
MIEAGSTSPQVLGALVVLMFAPVSPNALDPFLSARRSLGHLCRVFNVDSEAFRVSAAGCPQPSLAA